MVPPLSDGNGIPHGLFASHSLFAPHRLLAPLCGSDEELRAAFGQGGSADTMSPGPALAAVTELGAGDLPALSDDELTGVIHAARRLENRAFCLQAKAVAEFTRRRAGQLQEARDRGVPRGCRQGEHPDLELAAELLISRRRALVLMDETTELATRLPRTFAAMADGRIDPARGLAIADATLCLSDPDAARADEVLSAGAHEVRADTLARRAAALAMKLDPDAVRREREDARNTRQRVEARREDSGNACLAGREMDTAEVMAAKASIDAIAVRLRNAGAEGTLDALRSRAFLDLLQSRNPFARLDATPDTKTAGPDQGRVRQPAARADKPGPADATGSAGPGRAASAGPADEQAMSVTLALRMSQALRATRTLTVNQTRAGPGIPPAPAPRPAAWHRCPRSSTSSSPPPACSAGAPHPARPEAGDSPTPPKPATSSRPRPSTPGPAGVSRSSTRQAKPSHTPAPTAATPGPARRQAQN